MNKTEWLEIREIIGVCPTLTDEQIEATWDAIDKQMAQKPIGWNNDCWDCGESVSGFESTPRYCPNCGQKIDWEV